MRGRRNFAHWMKEVVEMNSRKDSQQASSMKSYAKAVVNEVENSIGGSTLMYSGTKALREDRGV